MENNLQLVHTIVQRLQDGGIKTVIFGGWAEELAGEIDPREHHDIDLLYYATDFAVLDEFLVHNHDLIAIDAKRFPHKRAFRCPKIMVELMLAQPDTGNIITNFWNEYTLSWPDFVPINVAVSELGTLRITPPAVIDFYRQHSAEINKIRRRFC